MEALKKFAAPAAGALALLFVLFAFKGRPVSKLWKGYTSLCVPANTDGAQVEAILRERNCANFISLEGQGAARGSYDERKSLYFFDKEKSFKIYYIPDEEAKEAGMAASLLQSRLNIDAMLGSRASFPYAVPLVCVAALLALLFYAENKAPFLLASLPGIFYALCNPFYAAAAAVCLELYALYLAQRLWRRKGAARALLQNRFFAAFSLFALAVSFAAGAVRALFFLLNLLCAACLLLLLFNIERARESRLRFLPVLIRKAAAVNAVGADSLKKSFWVSAEIFVLFVLLCAGSNFLSSGGKEGLFFPAPTEYNEAESAFPTMEDYYGRKWNEAAAPYRSLNREYPAIPKEGEAIEMPRYEKTAGGIQEKKERLFVYGKAFRKAADDDLDKAEKAPIERLWKAQGKAFSVSYVSGAMESGGAPLAAALVLCALLPLFCSLACRPRLGGRTAAALFLRNKKI